MEKTPSTQISRTTTNLSPVRAKLLSDDEEELPQEEKEDSSQEFFLAIEELESVISYNATDDRTYNLKSNYKKEEIRNLDVAFTDLEERQQLATVGKKRLKISEETEIPYPLYDTEDLAHYCEELDRISLSLNTKEKVRYVSKAKTKAAELDFFSNLATELRHLAKIYGKPIDEVHMLFMEVSCDLGLLKKALYGEKHVGWTELEDLAVQSEPGSVEYNAICEQRGKEEVEKRASFLEKR